MVLPFVLYGKKYKTQRLPFNLNGLNQETQTTI